MATFRFEFLGFLVVIEARQEPLLVNISIVRADPTDGLGRRQEDIRG